MNNLFVFLGVKNSLKQNYEKELNIANIMCKDKKLYI